MLSESDRDLNRKVCSTKVEAVLKEALKLRARLFVSEPATVRELTRDLNSDDLSVKKKEAPNDPVSVRVRPFV